MSSLDSHAATRRGFLQHAAAISGGGVMLAAPLGSHVA